MRRFFGLDVGRVVCILLFSLGVCRLQALSCENEFGDLLNLISSSDFIFHNYVLGLEEKYDRQLAGICRMAKTTSRQMDKEDIMLDLGIRTDTNTSKGFDKHGFSTNPVIVAMIAKEYLKCLNQEKNKCAGVKHFPNLGLLTSDPHFRKSDEVVDELGSFQNEIAPMKEALTAAPCSIMTTHVLFKAKGDTPKLCTFNRECVNYLRENMGYNGLVISDALNMTAATNAYYDLKFKPNDPIESEKWGQMNVAEKFLEIQKARLNTKYPNRKFTDDEIYRLTEPVDPDGSEVAIEAIKAGHDMVLLFRPSKKNNQEIEKSLTRMLSDIELSVNSNDVSANQIGNSTYRILKQKRSLNPSKFSKQYGNGTIDEILQKMSLRDKLREMIVIDGRKGFTEIAYRLKLGGVYLPERKSKKDEPFLLRMGDHEYPGNNRSLGEAFQDP